MYVYTSTAGQCIMLNFLRQYFVHMATGRRFLCAGKVWILIHHPLPPTSLDKDEEIKRRG